MSLRRLSCHGGPPHPLGCKPAEVWVQSSGRALWCGFRSMPETHHPLVRLSTRATAAGVHVLPRAVTMPRALSPDAS